MKIKLVIKDAEYCMAFKNNIVSADKDILVDVSRGGKLNGLDNKTIIVTDIEPKRVDKRILKQTVFLTKNQEDNGIANNESEYNLIFKYLRTSKILSFIEEVYCTLTGARERIDSSNAKIFAVCSDSNTSNSILCKTLARQIAYRKGGEILILPLRYINEYFDSDESDKNKFSRLLYNLKSNKNIVLDSYLFKDNYGINYASIERGFNPVSRLNEDDLLSFIKLFCNDKFNTLILDIGDCYSDTNNEIINKSDHILFFEKGTNFGVKDLLLSDDAKNRCASLSLSETDKDIELIIDNYVGEIYGLGETDYES